MGYETSEGMSVMAKEVLRQTQHLRRRALALTRNQADADDLVQDTLERALRAVPQLRPGSNVTAWLNTLMSHRFIDGWRVARRMRPLDAAVQVPAPEREAPPPWSQITPAEIDASIDELPATTARLVRYRYYQGMSYDDISRRLGVTVDTVGTRLFRARRRLQVILAARYLQPLSTTITPLPARRWRSSAGASRPGACRRAAA